DLAAQLRRLEFQSACLGLSGGLADCNVHRPLRSRAETERIASGLVVVLRGQFCQIIAESFRPADDVVDAPFQGNGIPPSEFGAQLDAVQRVGVSLPGRSGPISTQSSKDLPRRFKIISTNLRIDTNS